jgi:hypothetical protein
MARQMTAAMLSAIQSDSIMPALFVTATFQNGPIYVWTGYGSIAWNGQTWQGIGNLGTVTVVEEGMNVQARGITLSLSGFDSNLVNLVMDEFQLGSPATLYLGMFGGMPVALLADPIPLWAGRTDQAKIDVSGSTATIALNCESRLLDLQEAPSRRYTNDDQRLDYPQDRGFEFVYSIVETMITWGANVQDALNLNQRP